jgi:hypothetical protein
MLFNGGDCEQSNNSQGHLFACTDENGGPPADEGDQTFIIVTDIKGLVLFWHSGSW